MKNNNSKKRGRFVPLIAALAMALPIALHAQVSVSASAGLTGPTSYTSVNAAFSAINTGTHAGVITILITGNTTEPATPIPLLASGGTSTYTSISIKPSGGNFSINSAATPDANRGIIELAGADNVTIDGDDPATAGTQNLSIIATPGTIAGVACIRLSSNSSSGTDGANNNTVKNCIIIGARSSATDVTVNYAIQFSDGVGTSAEFTGAYASQNTLIQNNSITRCWYGIHAAGNSTSYLNTGTQIIGNTIGSATPASYVAFRGIDISYSSVSTGTGSALISQNDVRTGFTTASSNLSSIELATANAGVLVTRNNIHESINTSIGNWGMFGIGITSATSNSGITITNNFIRDMQGFPTPYTLASPYTGIGIMVNADATGLIINNNTIVLQVAGAIGGCIKIAAYNATVAQLLNNALINTVSHQYSSCIYLSTANNLSGGIVNNNDYYIAANSVLGYDGSNSQFTLASWKTAIGKDANSYTELPNFVSATDLHIAVGPNPTFLESTGAAVSITGVATDIDSQNRPGPSGSVNGGGTAPDIGADEFDGKPVTCFPVVSGSVAAITPTSAVVSWTPGITTPFVWELYYGIAPLAIPASTTVPTIITANTTYTVTGLIPSSNYSVYVRGNCNNNDHSPWALVSVFRSKCLPPVLSSVTGGSVCGTGTVNLQATGASTTQVYWYNNNSQQFGAISTGSLFVTPALGATTSYYATIAESNGATYSVGVASFNPSNGGINSGLGYGLNFDVSADFILSSVVVYPRATTSNLPGTITVGLLNANGNIIQQTTAAINGFLQTAGNVTPQTVNLNFAVSPGTNYRLALLSFTGVTGFGYIYTPLSFPYTIPNLVSITSDYEGYGTTLYDYDYFFKWQIQAGCMSAQLTPVVATVNQPPLLFALSTANGPVCAGAPVSLLSVGSSTSFTWSPSGSNTSNISVMPFINTTYTVQGEITPGCSSTATVAVTVMPLPNVSAITSNAIICSGKTVSLSASGNAATYVWAPNGGSTANALDTPVINTTYTVTGTSVAGCSATSTVFVTVNTAAPISIFASRQIICEGESTSLYAVSSAVSYAWSGGGTASMTVVSPTTTTTYSLVAGNGICTAMSSAIIIVTDCTGINELSGSTAAISVYPNPTSNMFTVELNNGTVKTIEIMDLTGRILFSNITSDDTVNFNMDNFANGIYYVKVQSDNMTRVIKIIKQ